MLFVLTVRLLIEMFVVAVALLAIALVTAVRWQSMPVTSMARTTRNRTEAVQVCNPPVTSGYSVIVNEKQSTLCSMLHHEHKHAQVGVCTSHAVM